MRRAGRAAVAWWSEKFDWPMAVVVLGFLAVLPIDGQVGNAVTASSLWLSHRFIPDMEADYESAIAAAAVKHPEYQAPLTVIPDDMMNVPVAHFGREGSHVDTKEELWVVLASELKKACSGDGNPTLKLQQVLGLPPDLVSTYEVTELSVPRDMLFRPCVGSGKIEDTRCGMDFPDVQADSDPAKMESAKAKEYDRLRFVARQMWNTYRLGFARSLSPVPGYRYTGYPFTGMGWTYNWARFAPSHVGVSEFVVRPGGMIIDPKSVTPAAFCQQAAS
jgi:hypothetical protein